MRLIIIALLLLTRIAVAEHGHTPETKIIYYFVSGGMPLSLPGLKNTLEVAKTLGYKVQALNDPVQPVLDHFIPITKAGLPLHYPTILVYKNGQACGPGIPGYKNLKAYQEIISHYDRECGKSWKMKSRFKVNTTNSATIIMKTDIPHENIGYYFKPINNDWITYHTTDTKQVYFFNRKTGKEFIAPGQFDSVPSPDAKFVTIPTPLRFYSLEKIWANQDTALNLQPDYSDENMQDEYQSIGKINNLKYRVATAWMRSVVYRDYSFSDEKFTPVDQPKKICNGISLSLPMISKNGLTIAGHSNQDASTKIFYIGEPDSECVLVQDLGFKTGKVAFSHDGNQIAFVMKDGDEIKAYAYQLKTKLFTLLMSASEAKKENLVFPDFLPNGNIIVMKVERNANRTHSTLFELTF